MKKHIVLGIAGYIGAGKTTAGEYLQQLGADFLEADAVVHKLYEPGRDGYRKIVNFYGHDFLRPNEQLNRSKLARFVFSDPHKITILNNLIHPLVVNEMQKGIDASVAFCIALEAIAFESQQLGKLVDKMIWIECDEVFLRERVLKRPGMDEKLFRSMLKSQRKPENIDCIVTNNDTKAQLYEQLDQLWKDWRLSG